MSPGRLLAACGLKLEPWQQRVAGVIWPTLELESVTYRFGPVPGERDRLDRRLATSRELAEVYGTAAYGAQMGRQLCAGDVVPDVGSDRARRFMLAELADRGLTTRWWIGVDPIGPGAEAEVFLETVVVDHAKMFHREMMRLTAQYLTFPKPLGLRIVSPA